MKQIYLPLWSHHVAIHKLMDEKTNSTLTHQDNILKWIYTHALINTSISAQDFNQRLSRCACQRCTQCHVTHRNN